MRNQAILRLAVLSLGLLVGACGKPKPRECPESMEKVEAASVVGKEVACKSADGLTARWSTFHPDGMRWQVCAYEGGQAHGQLTIFHKNGQVFLEGIYRGGQKVGKWTQRDADGGIVAKGEYRDGTFIAGAPVGMQATCENKKF